MEKFIHSLASHPIVSIGLFMLALEALLIISDAVDNLSSRKKCCCGSCKKDKC